MVSWVGYSNISGMAEEATNSCHIQQWPCIRLDSLWLQVKKSSWATSCIISETFCLHGQTRIFHHFTMMEKSTSKRLKLQLDGRGFHQQSDHSEFHYYFSLPWSITRYWNTPMLQGPEGCRDSQYFICFLNLSS
jgi:hypothetical protein